MIASCLRNDGGNMAGKCCSFDLMQPEVGLKLPCKWGYSVNCSRYNYKMCLFYSKQASYGGKHCIESCLLISKFASHLLMPTITSCTLYSGHPSHPTRSRYGWLYTEFTAMQRDGLQCIENNVILTWITATWQPQGDWENCCFNSRPRHDYTLLANQ